MTGNAIHIARRSASVQAGACALTLLAWTFVHHAYGAIAFGTVWRLHIVALIAPAAIAIVFALGRGAAQRGGHAGRLWTRLAVLVILLVPVGAIGFYEGGYNHVFKNLVYFIAGEPAARTLFPPPLYEMPTDIFFETSGMIQFPLSIATAALALRLFRGAGAMTRLDPGRPVPIRHVGLLSGETLDLADRRAITHLQFRRFAGCPVCNMHLRSFVRRRTEVDALVREVVVFHSRPEELAAHAQDIPFGLVADPQKTLYRAYGVEAGMRSLLRPRAWPAIVRAVITALPDLLLRRRPMPPLRPEGGRYGLPADFLVSPDGIVLAAHYGDHADDQWAVDTLLSLAARDARSREGEALRRRRLARHTSPIDELS